MSANVAPNVAALVLTVAQVGYRARTRTSKDLWIHYDFSHPDTTSRFDTGTGLKKASRKKRLKILSTIRF